MTLGNLAPFESGEIARFCQNISDDFCEICEIEYLLKILHPYQSNLIKLRKNYTNLVFIFAMKLIGSCSIEWSRLFEKTYNIRRPEKNVNFFLVNKSSSLHYQSQLLNRIYLLFKQTLQKSAFHLENFSKRWVLW